MSSIQITISVCPNNYPGGKLPPVRLKVWEQFSSGDNCRRTLFRTKEVNTRGRSLQMFAKITIGAKFFILGVY